MKRFIVLCFVLTIALASVCWANEITGTWVYDHQGMIVPDADPEELEETNKALNDFMQELNVEVYITARSDGAMVLSYVYKDDIDARIGDWYKYAPNKYVFIYSFSTLTREDKKQIDYMEIKDGVLEFSLNKNEENEVIYYFDKVEEE